MIFRSTTKTIIPAFLLTLLLIGVLALYSHEQMGRMSQGIAHLYTHHGDKYRSLQQMRTVMRDRMALTSVAVVGSDETLEEAGSSVVGFAELGERLEALEKRFAEHFQLLMTLSESDEERAALSRLKQGVEEVSQVCKQTTGLLVVGQRSEARALYFNSLTPGHEGLLELLDQLEVIQLNNLRHEATSLQGEYQQTLHVVDTIALAAMLGVVVIGLWLFARLRADRRTLEEANASLEQQVASRTRELSDANLQLHEAQRVGRMGHWEWDIEAGVLYWSDEIYRIFGVIRGEYEPTYENFLAAVHPDDRELVVAAVAQALEGEGYSLDHRILWPDGTEHEVHERGEVHRDAEGRPARMLGTVHDVTEQKHAERELRLAAQVFENTGDGVMIADRENHIIDVNDAFQAITGYELEEVRGENPRLLKSGRHQEEFYQAMWDSINTTGQWQGEVWDRHKDGHIFPVWMTINAVSDEHGELINYVGIFRDITQVKRTEQELWHSAHHDPLTGLPNRSLMYARLQLALTQADRDKRVLALMLIDLDGFKAVNDTLGHAAGDQLLIHVAAAMGQVIRDSDTLARYAGDEFTVLLKGLHSGEEAGRVAEKLLEAIAQPLEYEGESVQVGASIGVALYPANADAAESLIARADQAMYQAKRGGKNRYHYFGDY